MNIDLNILTWFFKKNVMSYTIYKNSKFVKFRTINKKPDADKNGFLKENDWLKITYSNKDGFDEYDVILLDDYKLILREYKIKEILNDFS